MQTEDQTSISKENSSDPAGVARREIDDAKARLSGAADRVRHEAQHAGSTISMLVLDELDRRAADMGTQLRSVSERLRGKADSGQADASPAMADHAADLIEDLSSRLEGQSIRDIGHRLGRFGRENPALFVMGCLLTGAMAGRMIVASGGASASDGKSRTQGRSYDRTGSSDPSEASMEGADTGVGGGTDLGQGTSGYQTGDTAKADQHIAGYGNATPEASRRFAAGRSGSGTHD